MEENRDSGIKKVKIIFSIRKTLNEALSVTNQDIAEFLDGLSSEKMLFKFG